MFGQDNLGNKSMWLAIGSSSLTPPTPQLARVAGLRVLAQSPAVLVVDKPSGLRSTPAFVGGTAGSTRKKRWCAAASTLLELPPRLRSHAAILPRTRDKFVRFAVSRAGLGESEAAVAWRALVRANEEQDARDGVTEVDSVLRRVRAASGGFAQARLVHRLDASTSGVLALALDAPSAAALSRQWRDRSVSKRYEAVVAGALPDGSGEVCLALSRCAVADRLGLTRMVPARDGLPCRTTYTVTRRHANGAGGWTGGSGSGRDDDDRGSAGFTTTVELTPHTGRLHQLRAHMAAIGHPILGDDIYSGPAATRLCLHAKSLAFVEPASGQTWRVDSHCDWGAAIT